MTKRPGPFKLEVEWIKARSGSHADAQMVHRDIAYVEQGNERHKLDIYAPTDGENHLIVFWIHGGGWRKGDKAGVQSKPKAFVENGFVSVNYRCVPVDTAAYDVASQVKSIGPLRRSTYTAVFGEDEESQKELSPMTYVAEGKGIPPFLILHVASRSDSTARSQAFADALKKAGVDAKVFAAEGKDHGSINRELGQPDDPPTKALFEFVNGAL